VTSLKRTALFDCHRALGGRMVEFAGYEMPVQYTSILAEHRAVRSAAGLFDTSHMGQIEISGPRAVAALESLVTCPVTDLRPGRVRYGLLCNERGGTVDDVTVYRLAEDRFFLCVNAASEAKDDAWLRAHLGTGAELTNRSAETAMLALQGPVSLRILARLTDLPLGDLPRFGFLEGKLTGASCLVSRTGYTGSDGFELYLPAADAAVLFEALLENGREHGLIPAGLGARDTLRLEAALPLYGHELDDETSPLEAGLARFVKLAAGGFIGAEALRRQQAEGLRRVLVGFELTEGGIARAEYPIRSSDGSRVGRVTSGAHSPSLGKSIGLGYVPPSLAPVGSLFEIGIRGRGIQARVVETPFVRAPEKPRGAN